MRKKIELILVILVIAGLVMLNRNLGEYVTSEKIETKGNVVVLDPGHGGEDPGKVGVNDALEKDINLAIAKKVKKYLEKSKIEVVMTREEDKMLSPENSRNKKIEDMKERVKIIDESNAALAVSIHQNSYQESAIKGAQVFYYAHSQQGENAAKIMQDALLKVDESNTRQAKANETYYLLKRTKIPTIIVECGFLSNPEEVEKLATEEYQDKIAKAIVEGITACLSD
ncbi:MAG: N-acetylmuramoyl-L-alanine amidase CwlD [Dorea sp.]